MNLRTQLAAVDSKIKVIEIVPPSVETALHRDRKDPDGKSLLAFSASYLMIVRQQESAWQQDCFERPRIYQ